MGQADVLSHYVQICQTCLERQVCAKLGHPRYVCVL